MVDFDDKDDNDDDNDNDDNDDKPTVEAGHDASLAYLALLFHSFILDMYRLSVISPLCKKGPASPFPGDCL